MLVGQSIQILTTGGAVMKKTGQFEAEAAEFDFDELAEKWPAPIVARDQRQLDKFSGGLICARTLANYDCQGLGPKPKIKVGRKVAYPVGALVEFLKKRQVKS
jgi:hypothetical protein